MGFWLINIALAISKIAFTLRPDINLFTEEAQYWLWSQNLAWHYYSKPPLIALFNLVSTSIFGINELGVRINAIVLGMGTSWVVYLFALYSYKSHKTAFWSGILVMAMPFWMLFSTFHLTDSELTFFWVLSIFWVYKGIDQNATKWWVAAGIAAGMGVMSKSTMVLIGPFIITYLLLTGQWKTNSRNFFVFLGSGAIGFIPGFIWNWQNGFSTYRHLAALGGVSGSGPGFEIIPWLTRFLEYLGGQAGMVSVFLFPVIVYSIGGFRKSPDKLAAFLILPAILSWLCFAGITLFTSVEANWPVFAYVTLPVYLSNWLAQQSARWVRIRNWGVSFSMAIPLVMILPKLVPDRNCGPVSSMEVKSFKRLVGYRPLAQRVKFLQDSLQIKDAVVFSESYHMASELAFYLPDHPQTYTVNLGARKNQFDLWSGLEEHVGLGKDGIFVSWNSESPGLATTFKGLLYEEKFLVSFKGDSLRYAKIQIWDDLLEFNPSTPDTY